MRVALITWDWPAFEGGGVARVAATLAEGLAEAGAEVEVWTRGGGSRDRALRQQAAGLPFVVRGFPGRSWRRRGEAHWRRGLTPALRRFMPSRILVSTWEPVPALLPALREIGGPTLGDGLRVLAHGREITGVLDPEREGRRGAIFAAGLRWYCFTRWLRGELVARGVRSDAVALLPPAVSEPPALIPRRVAVRERLTLISVGRLIARKGHDVVLRALALLRARWPLLRYQIVGDGPQRGALRALTRRLDLVEVVDFTGQLDPKDLEQAWGEATLLVLPTRREAEGDSEGFGLVFLEAGARGLPVIAGRVDGVAEAVRHEQTGLLLVDPRDPVELAALLDRLLGDGALRQRLGSEGRRRYLDEAQPAIQASWVLEDLRQPEHSPCS